MNRVILFGATGQVGTAIAKELVRQGYDLTIVVRSEKKAAAMAGITKKYVVADVCGDASLSGLLQQQDVVVSALGKSVSLTDKSGPGFRAVDYCGNRNILQAAVKKGVEKFVYISAFHAEQYPHLAYCSAHHDFSKLLQQSGLNYSIIKPPAVFSAFLDMIPMAEQGKLVNIGNGDKKTNPVYEGDLAKIVVNSITQKNSVIEAGGKYIYSRRQLTEMVQRQVNGGKRLRTVPTGLVRAALPFVRLFDKNTYDKLAFFLTVLQTDTIAPRLGILPFEEYIRNKVKERNAVLPQ